MGLTITHKNPISLGSMNGVTCFVAFDDSYPTGGESLTPGMLGMQQIVGVIAGNASGYMFEYDYTNQKLKAFTPTAAQAAVVETTAAVLAKAGAEVGNETNLSGLTNVPIFAIGY